MSFGLRGAFSNVASPLAGSALAANVSATPKTTITGAISVSCAQNAVSAAAVQRPEVNANQAGAQAAAKTAQDGLAGAKANIQDAKAAVVEGVQHAQREIAAACKANEVQAGGVFPNTQMAGTEADLLISGLAETSMGSGTAAQVASGALKASDFTGVVSDISAGLKNKPADEVKAAIRDTLCADEPGFGLVQTVQTAAVMENAPVLDWKAICAADPNAMDEIMHFDAENPSDAFPEMCALNDALAMIDEQMDVLQPLANEPPPSYCATGVAFSGELACPSLVIAEGQCGVFDAVSLMEPGKRMALAELAGTPASDNEAGLKEMAVAANVDAAPPPLMPAPPMQATDTDGRLV